MQSMNQLVSETGLTKKSFLKLSGVFYNQQDTDLEEPPLQCIS